MMIKKQTVDWLRDRAATPLKILWAGFVAE
jgi:hypothetical protein